MTIEKARRQDLARPWGRTDCGHWAGPWTAGELIGETWFERPDFIGQDPDLLLKLLYTSQRLSIQVHPDDASARAMGLPRGKTEAWYVLEAVPGAAVAVGLTRELTAAELRASIANGSIEHLIAWRPVEVGDFVFVPAGTIHAIGAGIVLAEIQQRSDTTFRMFDFGRDRALQVESALAVARAEVAPPQSRPQRLSGTRTLLQANPHFVIEHLDLPASSAWQLSAQYETWLLGIGGGALVGELELAVGEAIYLQAQHATLRVGASGLGAVVAYLGGMADPMLLTEFEPQAAATPLACKAQPWRPQLRSIAIASAPGDL